MTTTTKRVSIFGHDLPVLLAPLDGLLASLDRECSLPIFLVESRTDNPHKFGQEKYDDGKPRALDTDQP